MASKRRKRKTPTQLEEELKSARRAARNARERLKAYKQGLRDGMDLALRMKGG